jgi:pimeloyl-ACP methyl ester carboxylesterase
VSTGEPGPTTAGPDTVVLIHGLWLTARSWEHWVPRYEQRGFRVIAESWPGLATGDDDVEAIRRDPSVLEGLGVPEIVDHYDQIIRNLGRSPIIIGHSFGALVTQLLLDRGLGAAGVALAPAPPKGIVLLPLSTLRSAFPALKNPANRDGLVPLSHDQFRYRFTNTIGIDESVEVYDRYYIPGTARVLWQAGLANVTPAAPTTIDFRDEHRAPLLLVAGGQDHISPPSLVRAICGKYRSTTTVTEYKEFPRRSHWTAGEPGWEAVADDAIEWAIRNT